MAEKTQRDATEVSDRVIRFIGVFMNQPGTRKYLVGVLNTDYKRLTRFITLTPGERPVRDIPFLLEILGALGFNAGEVFDAAEVSETTDDMRLRLRDRLGDALRPTG